MPFPKFFPNKTIKQNLVVYFLLLVIVILFNAILYKVQMRSYDTIADYGCFEIDPVVDQDDYYLCIENATASK